MKHSTLIHKCKIENGKIIFFNSELLRNYLKAYEGKHLNVTFKLPSKNRSNNQNSYYWGVVLPLIAEWVGEETTEEIHETMKSMFNIDRNKKIPIVKSTVILSTVEFNEYLEKIIIWAAKQGVVIPDPKSS